MTIKQCYILDNSRGFIFYGPLDENLVGTTGYNLNYFEHKKEMDILEIEMKYGRKNTL